MTPATSGLVNSGINALRAGRKAQPGGIFGMLQQLKNRPAPGTGTPTTPSPAAGAPAPTNVAPPGSPLPVGNGIVPVSPNPAVLRGMPPAPTPTPVPNVPEYSPTGLNFGPGHDLQSSVIQPGADPRLTAAGAATDAAVGAVGGVDRRQAAQDILSQFDKAAVDSNREDYRQVGQQAAALGRLGMGQTAQDVQEVGRKHLTDRATLETNLAAQTAAQEAQDRLDKANLARGVEGDIYGYGAGNRGELRTERGYQTGQAQTAIDRNVQQAQLEEALRNGQFSRGLDLANFGRTGNPATAKLASAAAGDASSADDLTGIMELLKRYGYGSATAGKKAA
jgi:hypothetical protein